MAKKTNQPKTVETLKHPADSRKNIPTAEYESVLQKEQQSPIRVAYERRNRDLDPQLVWRGKDEQDWSDLVVHAPPLYIQEKVHPKVLINDLLRRTSEAERAADRQALLFPDLYADFNGMPEGADKTDFYQHEQNWSNRMILGGSNTVWHRTAAPIESCEFDYEMSHSLSILSPRFPCSATRSRSKTIKVAAVGATRRRNPRGILPSAPVYPACMEVSTGVI
jgi:hypothetical protein